MKPSPTVPAPSWPSVSPSPLTRLEALRASARTALPKPAIRLLEQRWDADEITAEDYQQQRLSIEFQTQLRLAEKYRKRLKQAERERQSAISAPLQDHEIAHVWAFQPAVSPPGK